MAPKPPPPKAFQEALDWFAARIPFTTEEMDALDEETRQRAFYVSGVTQLRLVGEVHAAITKAIESGTTLAQFKADVAKKLTDDWGEERPARLETIFRTNVQSAYNAGRLEQFEEPLMKRLRPYRGWSVVVDKRTTEFICRPLVGVTVPADSKFARDHIPPLHFSCRTGLMSFSLPQAEEQGITAEPPNVKPAEGFGGDPRAPLKVDVSDEPTPLRKMFAAKMRAEDVVVGAVVERRPKTTKPVNEAPAEAPPAPVKPGVVQMLSHFRATHMADMDKEFGFAQATTKELAESMGVSPGAALKLLQKAAKEGLVVRAGHEGTRQSGKASSDKGGFGFQTWELMNTTTF